MMALPARVNILIVVLLLSTLSIQGASYYSNSIGQKLELLSGGSQSETGYILQIDGPEDGSHEMSLLHDGYLEIFTRVTIDTMDSLSKRITQTTYDTLGRQISQVIEVYQGSLIMERSVADAQGENTDLFSYENGRLIMQKTFSNGKLHSLTDYFRNARDGSLAGVRIIVLNGEPYIRYFSQKNEETVIAEGSETSFTKSVSNKGAVSIKQTWQGEQAVLSSSVKYDDTGNLRVEEISQNGRIARTFNTEGLLIAEQWLSGRFAGNQTEYIYDGKGNLVSSRESSGSTLRKTIQRWYDQGVEQSREEWEGDYKTKSSRILEGGGSLVTLYEKGRPYADVTYASDGKKVVSLSYYQE